MRRLPLSLCLLAAVLLACRERSPQSTQRAGTPPTAAPADLSHGEARVGSAEQPSPIDPAAPPRSSRRLHRLRIEINHKRLTIASGVTYDAWTFDGRVPGPCCG